MWYVTFKKVGGWAQTVLHDKLKKNKKDKSVALYLGKNKQDLKRQSDGFILRGLTHAVCSLR